jgi:hypothetical protein
MPMTAQPFRFGPTAARDPVVHDLPALHLSDRTIAIHLLVRRADDGAWRARLRFTDPGQDTHDTAEIFCAESEPELWEAVRSLPEHHVRALYLSLI